MTLQKAIRLAMDAHGAQVDKAGNYVFLHALRVMFRVKGTDAMIVAVLHDVLEDTDAKIDGLSPQIARALDAVTRRDGEQYFDYIKRVAKDPIGRQVKCADLRDHLDRKDAIPESLRKRYRKALKILLT